MKEKRFGALMDNLEIMIEFILKEAEIINSSTKLLPKLRLVAEEVLVNIISYGYGGGTGDIEIRVDETDKKEIYIEIADSGIEFNPLEKKDPDINLPMEERTIGGLGIFMVKNIMDSVEYEYRDGKNILKMIKKL